jgi:hypothetical protein
MQAVQVVQRSQNEVSCCPPREFYRLSHQPVTSFWGLSSAIQISGLVDDPQQAFCITRSCNAQEE